MLSRWHAINGEVLTISDVAPHPFQGVTSSTPRECGQAEQWSVRAGKAGEKKFSYLAEARDTMNSALPSGDCKGSSLDTDPRAGPRMRRLRPAMAKWCRPTDTAKVDRTALSYSKGSVAQIPECSYTANLGGWTFGNRHYLQAQKRLNKRCQSMLEASPSVRLSETDMKI